LLKKKKIEVSMNKIVLSLLLTFFLFTIWSCSNDDPPVMVASTPSIDKIKTADKWNPRLAQKYKVEVSVIDPQGPGNIAGVLLTVQRDSGGPVIYTDSLYDDGAYYNEEDGDVLAKDGIYSNRFLPSEIIYPVEPGTYIFQFTAKDRDGNHSQASELVVNFGANNAPTIVSIFAPDSFSVNLVPGLMQVTVSDSDGIDDIERVYFESRKEGSSQIRYEGDLFNDGNPDHGDLIAGDEVFSTLLDTSLLVAKKGNYRLLFHIVDSFNEKNIIVPEHEISLDNYIPRMTDIQVSERVAAPTGEEVRLEPVTVSVSDPEGLADIDSVYFYSVKWDSTLGDSVLANNGLPILLRDNGLPVNINDQDGIFVGDEVAGDGIYTFTVVIKSDFIPPNDKDGKIERTFKFYTSDKAGNKVGPIAKKIEIYKPE
jgi:hypothetical protein